MIRLESLFDEDQVQVDKSYFMDMVKKKIKAGGQQVEIIEDGDELVVKAIDPFVSQGYNVFKDNSEYRSWLRATMYEPEDSEIMEGLNGSGA